MKSIIKIMSACVLVVATANCSTLDQGQQVTIGIKNNVASVPDKAGRLGVTDKPSLFGNVYETNTGGKVLGENHQYYELPFGQCLKRTIFKPKTVAGRITKYHRVIVATTKQALKDKVTKNKNSNEVESVKIQQSTKKKDYENDECYSIKKGTKKKIITIVPNMSCGECKGMESPTAMNIKDI